MKAVKKIVLFLCMLIGIVLIGCTEVALAASKTLECIPLMYTSMHDHACSLVTPIFAFEAFSLLPGKDPSFNESSENTTFNYEAPYRMHLKRSDCDGRSRRIRGLY